MADDKKDKGKFDFVEFATGIFVLFTALFYVFPSFSFVSTWFVLSVLFIIAYFFIGLISFLFTGKPTQLLAGTAMLSVIIFLFPQGLAAIQEAFHLIGL